MPNSTLRLLIAVALLLTASPALAQRPGPPISVEIHGQVRFANGGAPAEHVLVRLEKLDGGVAGQMLTDRSGKFRFSGLAQTQYVVSVRASGFKEAQQQVNLQTATSEYVLLQLAPAMATAAPASPPGLVSANVPAEAQKEFIKGQAALLESKKIEEGVRHLEKAVSLYPDFLEAQLLLGTAYMDARKWEKAERALRRALEINPKTAPALFALGEVYRQQGNYVEAEQALQEGLQLDARSWQGHFTLGRVYFALGDLAKAGPEAGRTIQLKPDFAEAHLLAGNILLRARRPEHALPLFEEYLRLDPKGAFAAQTRETIEKIKRALAEKKQ
jgi:tetratricopeptide (TPR) repeat protein